MALYYDRNKNFVDENTTKMIPFIKLEELPTDKTFIYIVGKTRLDVLSEKFYNSPYYGWLIMLANPQFGGLEFLIPDNTLLRIPYPLESGLDRYITEVRRYKTLYGE